MYKKPIDKSPGKKQSLTHSTSSSNINPSLYFCHFKNAMYMGGIKAFQRNGRGLLLHDNGTNVISSYYNDLLHGHNIFFSNSCFLSADFVKNKLVEGVYRTDGFLLVMFYNSEGQLDGKVTLLNYVTRSILMCTFKKGVMVEKREETDFTLINRVFDLNEVDFLIGKKHAKAVQYSFQKQNNLNYQKIGSRLIIGYQKHGLTNGLAFSYLIRNTSTHHSVQTPKHQDPFQLNLLQRGYYINGQLNGFGEKIFKNGNSYIGQFKCDTFEGSGILKNNLKKNWVSGHFEKGNLVDLLEYNHQGGDKKYDKIIQAYHEKRSNWINNQVQLIDWEFFDQEIQKIISTAPNTQVKTLEQRKLQVLKKIQQNFICENNLMPGPSTLREIQQFTGLKNSNIKSDKESVRKFVRNFIPEGQSPTIPKFYPSPKARERQLQRQREIENRQLSQSRKKSQMMVQSRRSKVSSIRKSKIFEGKGVTPSKSVDSFLKLQRVPVKNQQQKGSRMTKNKSNIQIGNSRMNRSQIRPDESQQSPKSRASPRNVSSSGHFTRKTSPERQHDSKKLIGKSRIFSYLNSQDEDITPKFHYNQNQLGRSVKKQRIQQQQEAV